MTTVDIAEHDVISFDDLRLLASASSPSINVVDPIPNPIELPARIKDVVNTVRKELAERITDARQRASLLEPIQNLAATIEHEGIRAHSWSLFRSPDVFRYYFPEQPLKESVSVAERFQLRPLLSTLTREQRFHILGLSQKYVRLFHCTQHSAQEAELHVVVPRDMREWMEAGTADHVLTNRASGVRFVGSMKGVVFGTNTDRERADEYLRHFLKDVDKGIRILLGTDTAPLVAAGVDYELAIYCKVNTYPHLLQNAVHGSPDGMPARLPHERATEIIMHSFSEPLRKALAAFQTNRDSGRLSFLPQEIVRAAYEGRVAEFFFSSEAQLKGTWDEMTNEIRSDEREEDLLNATALQVILYRGRAFELSAQDMPDQAEVAALLRF
jgi:hypothetical protein